MNRYIHALSPVFVIATALMLSGCSAPPQLGDNRDALAVADSLWTAITAKRTDLVESSASRLAQLREADKLPAAASLALDSIVDKARAGKWDAAREDLKSFVKGQRGGPSHTARS